MSLWLEEKYLKQLSHRLEGFRDKGGHVFNCRCPLCGDSKKKTSKKRGYFYARVGKLFYSCKNCNASQLFTTFLHNFDFNLYQQYKMEAFKENLTSSTLNVLSETEKHIPETKKYIPDIFEELPLLRDIEHDLPAYQLAIKRKLPIETFDFRYAEDFIEWTLGNTDKFEKWKGPDHSRIIIPWRDRDNKIMGYSARALDDTQEQKYYRIFVDEELKEKYFGLDRLDDSKQVYVLEGEIDSLMLPNAIAVSNSKLHSYVNKNAIYIPDADRRNPHICRGINEMITMGLKVCLMPKSLPEKDLNKLVEVGWTTDQLLDMINENTVSGLKAKLEFTKWKEC